MSAFDPSPALPLDLLDLPIGRTYRSLQTELGWGHWAQGVAATPIFRASCSRADMRAGSRSGRGATSRVSATCASSASARRQAAPPSGPGWRGRTAAQSTSPSKFWDVRPFALGRHSLMNRIGVWGGSPPDVQQAQGARLAAFARGDDQLREWRSLQCARLAGAFDCRRAAVGLAGGVGARSRNRRRTRSNACWRLRAAGCVILSCAQGAD